MNNVPTREVGPDGSASGFSLIEMMLAIALLMIVTGTVLQGMLDTVRTDDVVTNRTDMHNGVRNATELLTQEVGQAGRVTLPAAVSTSAATPIAGTTLTVTSTAQMFQGERLIVDTGATQETVRVVSVDSDTQLTVAPMDYAHTAGVGVTVSGGFASGVVPDNMVNGSSGNRLKIYGDINGTGNMVYVEYWCDLATGRLYRNVVPITQAAPVPAPTVEQVLVDNILANPPNPGGGVTPCFTYRRQTVAGTTYVTDVAITLTVQTQRIDPVTKRRATETKALLNVAPRNVFNVWQLASLGVTNRIQPMPPNVAGLIATNPS